MVWFVNYSSEDEICGLLSKLRSHDIYSNMLFEFCSTYFKLYSALIQFRLVLIYWKYLL